MKRILLASQNRNKTKEYNDLLNPYGYEVLDLFDVGFTDDIDESGSTYEENAYIKAKSLFDKTVLPIMADDSGLEILSLNGFPGLHSSRFQKEMGSYASAYEEIFNRLKGKDREARFICVICLLDEEGMPHYFKGTCPGYILEKPSGMNGFGYDPIFHSIELDKDLGLASEEEKNLVSHRGKALRLLVDYLSGNAKQ